MTTRYVVELTCPKCGAELEHVNSRQPGAPGYSAMAIAKCPRPACPEWELRVELITCGFDPPLPAPERARS